MKGPSPKPAHLRQRKNRKATAAVLSGDGRKRAPSLPRDRKWHLLTVSWWHDIWHSPMASEFLKSDIHSLFRLAVLVDRFWFEPTTTLAAEIRQQQAGYGLTPLDRRRLEWEIKKVEGNAKPSKSRKPKGVGMGDPRDLLRVVK